MKIVSQLRVIGSEVEIWIQKTECSDKPADSDDGQIKMLIKNNTSICDTRHCKYTPYITYEYFQIPYN